MIASYRYPLSACRHPSASRGCPEIRLGLGWERSGTRVPQARLASFAGFGRPAGGLRQSRAPVTDLMRELEQIEESLLSSVARRVERMCVPCPLVC